MPVLSNQVKTSSVCAKSSLASSTATNAQQANHTSSMPKKLFLRKPATPGKVYGTPGAGYSGHISVMTAIVLIALWFLVTSMGWIKPNFLPTPFALYNHFIEASTLHVDST